MLEWNAAQPYTQMHTLPHSRTFQVCFDCFESPNIQIEWNAAQSHKHTQSLACLRI